jgi:hypothetical protein
MFNVYDLFLAGIGFDIAGAYLVSRGLLQRIPQLATLGGTMYALERPRATYAVEDRIRGSAGLVALVVGFVFQAVGYSVYLAERTKLSYGAKEALAGAVVALVPAVGIPLVEAAVRPRVRDRILVKVARFDWEGGDELRPRPAAHVLRSFGEQLGKPPEPNEDDGAYCQRVFGVEAEVLS